MDEGKKAKESLNQELHALRIRLAEAEVQDLQSQQLKLKLAALEQVVDNIHLGVTITDTDGRIIFTNRAEAQMHGYTVEELIGQEIKVFLPGGQWSPMSKDRIKKFKRLTRDSINVRRDGSTFHIRLTSDVVRNQKGEPLAIVTTSEEVTRRKQAEAVQTALFRISDRCSRATDLKALCSDIHNIVGGLIFARNFFVGQYQTDPGLLSYLYYVDEFGATPAPAPLGKGLIQVVIESGEPLYAGQDTLEQLILEEGLDAMDSPFVAWLGIPLKAGTRVLGLLGIKSYTEDIQFGRDEQELLLFVSQQLAGAVVRLQP